MKKCAKIIPFARRHMYIQAFGGQTHFVRSLFNIEFRLQLSRIQLRRERERKFAAAPLPEVFLFVFAGEHTARGIFVFLSILRSYIQFKSAAALRYVRARLV